MRWSGRAGRVLAGGGLALAALLLVTAAARGEPVSDGVASADGGTARLIVRAADAAVAPPVPDGARLEQSATARELAAEGTRVLRVPADRADRVTAALRAHPLVAEVARPVPFTATQPAHDAVEPDDPRWDDQWGVRRIQADHAWAVESGSPEVTVAVIDTGVEEDHEDFAGAVQPGRNFVDDRREGDTDDAHGHGTQAAGLAAARTDNATGVAGVCWSCRILPVRVLDDDGRGNDADIAAGVRWAADQGAEVINLSFSGPFDSSTLKSAVAYAERRGALLVGAAGNSLGGLQGALTDGEYPARYEEVLGVAGSDPDDNRYSWSHHGDWVDVAAPGCAETTDLGDGYDEPCGTSVAAPLVSGQAALVLSTDEHAGLHPEAHRDLIRDTAEPVDYVASGRVDAYAAVTSNRPEEPAAVVTGATFIDADLDGARAEEDEGVAGEVVLRDGDGERVASQQVGAEAPGYSFEVPGGDYTVAMTAAEPDAVQPRTDTEVAVSLDDGGERVVDFGYATTTGVIDGLVFRDGDEDGAPGDDPDGVGGVTLALHDEHDGSTRELTTDADGRYAAEGLWHGPYRVEVADDAVRATTEQPVEVPLDPHESATVDLGVVETGDADAQDVDDGGDGGTGGVVRLAGGDRFATAAAIARDTHPAGADTVLVATGADYPDALAGGAAAAARDAPVLLVTRDAVPAATTDALAELAPRRIVVLGGEAAVSASVERELAGGGATVERLGAGQRFATAAAISSATFEAGVDAVFVATGADYPDALAGAATAAANQAPVLLTAADTLPSSTRDELERLRPERIVVLGGAQAVSDGVEAELAALAPGGTVRHAGGDRFATAAAAARAETPAAARAGEPLLLVTADAVPVATAEEIRRRQPRQPVIVGGASAVSSAVADELRALAR